MNDYLLVSVAFCCIGVFLFALSKMRLINDKVYVPVFLSSFIFIGFYSVAVLREFVIPFLGFSDQLNRLLFYDYGNGLLGLLPLVLATLFIGRYLLKMDYQEQWSGTTNFEFPSLKYGLIAGILLAAIPLLSISG